MLLLPVKSEPAFEVVVPPGLLSETSPVNVRLENRLRLKPEPVMKLIAVGLLGDPGGPAGGVVPVRSGLPAAPWTVRAPALCAVILAAVMANPVSNLGVLNVSVPVVFNTPVTFTPVARFVVVPMKLCLDPSPVRTIALPPAGNVIVPAPVPVPVMLATLLMPEKVASPGVAPSKLIVSAPFALVIPPDAFMSPEVDVRPTVVAAFPSAEMEVKSIPPLPAEMETAPALPVPLPLELRTPNSTAPLVDATVMAPPVLFPPVVFVRRSGPNVAFPMFPKAFMVMEPELAAPAVLTT